MNADKDPDIEEAVDASPSKHETPSDNVEKQLKEGTEKLKDTAVGFDDEKTVSKPADRRHVKDYETGISFTVHENPLGEPPNASNTTATTEPAKIPPRYRLLTQEDSLGRSLFALRVAVTATACGQTVLQPNFPFLVIPNASEDSFPSTDPFGFSSALYFLPLSTMLGTAITSAFVGQLSDRIGRRPCIMFCVGMMTITLIIQYLARATFWGFCATSFANGLFCSILPVAMAYASDVHANRAKKDEEIGALVGANMLGMSGGGIVAILMEEQGLFSPLLVAAGVDALAFLMVYMWLHEPDTTFKFDEDDGEDENDAPKTIDWKIFSNVIAGALLDNFGSSGLFPMTLAPLAFNTFLVELQPDPIMSENAYKWLSVCGECFLQ